MESKGRRASRAVGPSMNPAEAVPPAETPSGAAKPVESPAEELMSAKPPAEIVIPAATSMAPPSVEARAETVKSASSENLGDFGREAFAALVQSQTATDMLRVKTLADAIEVHTGFTRSSFDTLVDGSAKLSELGTKLAAEASQPILTQLGKGWIKATRFAF
jgi:hypothetical protein